MSNYLKLSNHYLPKSYKGRVNWYVSQYSPSKPIHVFRTLEAAKQWAATQPADIVGGVNMTASLDWFPAESTNLKEAINRKREYVDDR